MQGLAVIASGKGGGTVLSRGMVGHVAKAVALGPVGNPVLDANTVMLETDHDIIEKMPDLAPDVRISV